MADCGEQGCPDRIGKGSGRTMSLQISIGLNLFGFSIGFNRSIAAHLNGEAVDLIDVENVLGRVADQEGAADEKKHSAKAAQKRRNLILVRTTSFSVRGIFWSYLVSANIRSYKNTIMDGGIIAIGCAEAQREPDPPGIPFHTFRSAKALAFLSPQLLLVFLKPEMGTSLNFHPVFFYSLCFW